MAWLLIGETGRLSYQPWNAPLDEHPSRMLSRGTQRVTHTGSDDSLTRVL